MSRRLVPSVGAPAHLLGYLAHEIAFAHVLGAEDVEHVAVRAAVLDGGGGLAASGVAHHPADVLPLLGVGHGKGDALPRLALDDGPAVHAVAYLLRDTGEHVVADVLVLAVHHLADGGRAHALHAFGGAVLAGVVPRVVGQRLADGVLVFQCKFFHCLNGI